MATSLALATEAQTIYKTPQYEWRGNQFTQGRFKAKANSATDITSNYRDEWTSTAPNFMPDIDPGIDREHWTLKRDISHSFPIPFSMLWHN